MSKPKCKCIKELKRDFTKLFGIIEWTQYSFGMKGAGFPHLKFKFHPKKKDGTPAKNWKTTFLIHNFCSNCGVKLI